MGETKVKREPVKFDYEGLNWNFIRLLGEIGNYAKGKYGSIEQYADGRLEGEKSPVNHIFEHMRQYLAREPHDKFGDLQHHLAAVAYNAMMEFYYLTHGGPTVTDKLYRPDPLEPPQFKDDWPGIQDEVVPVQEPSTFSKGKDLLTTFFGRSDAGKSEGSVPEAGN